MKDLMLEKAQGLGATLYMPAINPHARRVFGGEDLYGAGSVVICLEDALHENDVERGLAGLRTMLLDRKAAGTHAAQRTMVFIRPRNLAMAHVIAEMDGIETVAGLIVPKMSVINGPGWFELACDHRLTLMPTFETSEYFDPGYVAEAVRMLDAQSRGMALAIRLGGNDLLNAMSLRRTPGIISHEGPLGFVLGMMGSQLMAAGYAVAAPVFDIIHDTETLEREVCMDIIRGFVGKTAIHPCQIKIIHDALRVSPDDLEMANAILDSKAEAVFQIRGVMCEPATHMGWARRIQARASRWGAVGVGSAHDATGFIAAALPHAPIATLHQA